MVYKSYIVMDVTGLQHRKKTKVLILLEYLILFMNQWKILVTFLVIHNLFESPDSSPLKIDMAEM